MNTDLRVAATIFACYFVGYVTTLPGRTREMYNFTNARHEAEFLAVLLNFAWPVIVLRRLLRYLDDRVFKQDD